MLVVLVASVFGVVPATVLAGTQSSPIAITPDDKSVWVVNPDDNSVSEFDVTTDTPALVKKLTIGKEPNSVAINADGSRVYVATSLDDKIAVLDAVKSKVLKKFPAGGVEPSALALSPNGNRLYVLNAASNTMTVFDTAPLPPTLLSTGDLSAFGTAPRAIAVTDDGDADDADETIFVAMFYGQLRAGKTFIDEGQDDQREGHVVAIATATALPAPNPVVLGPLANAGFNSNGRLAPGTLVAGTQLATVASTNPQTFTTPTGAYPNQLAAIALHPSNGKAYVVSTAASPNGPLRFNQMAQGLVSVFDAATRTETTASQTDASVRRTAPLNLNQGVNLATTPAPRLFMTNPVAMAWRPDGSDAWAVIQNGNLLVRLTVDGGGIPTIGAPLVAGPSTIVRVDLENPPAGLIAGKAPRGVAINSTGTRAYVMNFVSKSVTVVNIQNPTAPVIVGTGQSAKVATKGIAAKVQVGAELFFTGRGPDGRMSSESWGGCIVCHPNGRSDNVTWMFDAGPRQTISLDATLKKTAPHDLRVLNWTAVRDETQDFELNTRNVFGGRGLIDDDRDFYLIGGSASGADLGTINQFQQVTGAVTTTGDFSGGAALPTLPAGRRDFAVATLDDGRVYIIGGRSGAAAGTLVTGKDTVLEFDPRTNTLKSRSEKGFTPRHSFGAAAVKTSAGDRIYAVGGYGSTTGTDAPLATVEEFNPKTNKWRTVAPLATGVAQFGITAAGGINTAEPLQLIHVVSGNKGSEATPAILDSSTFTVQRFAPDPKGPGTWTTFNPGSLTPRRNHGIATALRGASSRVFIVGGQNAAGTTLDTVEEYVAQTVIGVSSTHTSLLDGASAAPRKSFGIASSLTTNQIYVVGGTDNVGATKSTILEYTINVQGSAAGPLGTPSGTWATKSPLLAGASGLQVSTPPGVTNFLTTQSTGRDPRQDSIEIWVAAKVRTLHAPVPKTDADAKEGRALFGQVGLVPTAPLLSCATCHGGKKWTRSLIDYEQPPSPDSNLGLGNEKVIGAELRSTKAQPLTTDPNTGVAIKQGVLNNVGTFIPNSNGGRVNEIRFNGADVAQAIAPLGNNGFNIPSLLSVSETAPYFYNGLAQTIEEVLNGSQDGNNPNALVPAVRVHFVTDAAKRAKLIQFLRSIDERTPTFK